MTWCCLTWGFVSVVSDLFGIKKIHISRIFEDTYGWGSFFRPNAGNALIWKNNPRGARLLLDTKFQGIQKNITPPLGSHLSDSRRSSLVGPHSSPSKAAGVFISLVLVCVPLQYGSHGDQSLDRGNLRGISTARKKISRSFTSLTGYDQIWLDHLVLDFHSKASLQLVMTQSTGQSCSLHVIVWLMSPSQGWPWPISCRVAGRITMKSTMNSGEL
jgi:hypothetical protein